MPTLPTLSNRARRLSILSTIALAGLIAACQAGPGATTPPTNPPTNPPTPAGPTPTPSPTPAPTFNSEQIQHPTGAKDIVLRMEQGGGFVPMNFLVTQAPQFTLYGDGTVIFQQIDTRESDPIGGQAYLPWLVGHLDEDGVQALLRFALGTGRLAGAKETYDNPMVADAGSTIFTLNAAGLQKVVNIYALFEGPDPNVPDQADRAGFSQLQAVLNNFATQDGLGDVTPYDANFYKVILQEGFGEPVGTAVDWPWDDLTTADFPAGDEPGGIAILDKAHVEKLLETPNGGHIGVWAHDPDGNLIQLGVRPLLPDEEPEG
jgi:hypothetical protein